MEGVSFLRYTPITEIENKINFYADDENYLDRFTSKLIRNKKDLINLSYLLQTFEKSKYCLRCETDILDIYTNDTDIFNSCLREFEHVLRFAFAPEEKDISILSNQKSIVVKKYPHNRYRFKIFLTPHKNIDIDTKFKFVSWLEAQGEKVTFSPSVKNWFLKTNWNWDRRYILVDSDQTLLMMKLKNSDYVGSVYEYIVSDK